MILLSKNHTILYSIKVTTSRIIIIKRAFVLGFTFGIMNLLILYVQGGAMLDRSFYEKADEIISAHGKDKKSLIPIMQDIQALYRYIPPELLSYVADKIGVTEAKAYSVATFYENFSFDQKGKYVIKVCDGTACHVRKGTLILERLYKELGLSDSKKTTDDMLFTVETVSCLGACGLAPVMTVNDVVHPSMTPDKVTETIKKLKEDEA